jgi:hypothetical protein
MSSGDAMATHDPWASLDDPIPAKAVVAGAGQSMLLTLIDSAGLIVSAFLSWIRPDEVRGIEISYRAFYRTTFTANASFLRSAGAVAVLIGLVAILGLASRAGWITRFAGALGIIGFALFTITLYRLNLNVPASMGPGPWFMLGGGLVAMFGGFFARRPNIVVANT